MPAVYPRAPEPIPDAPPFAEAVCVESLILLREEQPDVSKVRAAGKLIHVVGGRITDIYRVWDEIESERAAMAAVPLQAEAIYIEKISKVGKLLDPVMWVVGMRAKLGVGELVAPDPMEIE